MWVTTLRNWLLDCLFNSANDHAIDGYGFSIEKEVINQSLNFLNKMKAMD